MTSRPTPPRSRRHDALGATVVYCAGAACSRSDLPIRERLREMIRHCDHGVLVSAPCLLGALGCPAGIGARGDGLVLVERGPTARAPAVPQVRRPQPQLN